MKDLLKIGVLSLQGVVESHRRHIEVAVEFMVIKILYEHAEKIKII